MLAVRTARSDGTGTVSGGQADHDRLLRPRPIPVTRPLRYISMVTALNLRIEGEVTGDWHDFVLFSHAGEGATHLPCAGEGECPDTTPTLGDQGVRDMAHMLSDIHRRDIRGPVWVADHFRAIADIVMNDQMRLGRIADPNRPLSLRRQATVRAINAWLDTEDQVDRLVHNFLVPLRRQIDGFAEQLYDAWLPTVVWE